MAEFSVFHYWRSHRHFKVAAVIFIVLSFSSISKGLRMCYNCNTSTSGLECVYNPSNVTDGEISCKGYCTIRRKEYASLPPKANLISLTRSCEVQPQLLDEVFVESFFKIYFRTCKSYLCNRGSGIESLRDMPVDPSWDTEEDLSSSSIFQTNHILFYLSLLLPVMLSSCLLLGL